MTGDTSARLLVVDDEPAQMKALCDTLEDNGYQVVGRSNGEDALATLRQGSFDLLLADLMMPGMNGIELLRTALAIDPMLVGIIMTGEGTIITAVEAMQSGALDYILKPFKLSAILPVINRGLAMHRLRLENAALQARLREHAEELEATNRELDAFTRSASHDLRTPLNAIVGFSGLLTATAGPALPVEQRGWLAHIERSALRMCELIDALMRLSHLGRQALSLGRVDVAALVAGVADDLRSELPQHSASLQIGELPETTADASLLRQVFINLLSNAFKFTRNTERPTIEVGSELQGEERVFFVRDNGPGFDIALAEHVFDAFHRLHGAEAYEGHGVGLSIVERIVQRHGGRIWATAAPGQGATFFFTLARPEAATPTRPPSRPSPRGSMSAD